MAKAVWQERIREALELDGTLTIAKLAELVGCSVPTAAKARKRWADARVKEGRERAKRQNTSLASRIRQACDNMTDTLVAQTALALSKTDKGEALNLIQVATSTGILLDKLKAVKDLGDDTLADMLLSDGVDSAELDALVQHLVGQWQIQRASTLPSV